MKTKCSFILKSTLSIVLAIMVLIGTVSTVVAATIEHADLGAGLELTETGAKADLAETGYSTLTVYYKIGTGDYTSTSISAAASATFDVTLAASQSFKCIIKTDNNEWWGNASLNSSFVNLAQLTGYDGNYSSDNNVCTYTSSSAGTYTVTVQFNNDGKKIKIEGGGGDPDPDPDPDPEPEEETTETVSQKSGKTIIISYDRGAITPRDYAHAWQKNSSGTQSDIFNNGTMTAADTTLTKTTAGELCYVDLSTSLHSGSTYAVGWLAKCGDGWNSYQSDNQSVDPGKQGFLYRYNSNDNPGSYDPLELTSVTYPSKIYKDQTSTFTVTVDKGVPYFLNTRDTTTSEYQLKVGTTSGGSQVMTATNKTYANRSTYTFDLTPSAKGTITLYYTLTDGIDTVTYSKAYTVVAKHDVTFSATAGGSISPSGTSAVEEDAATSVTATPAAGYDFSGWTLGTGITCADDSTSTISITTAASGTYTVQANFTSKPLYPITVTTNNAAYGTASASPAYAYEGQTVTLTAVEDTGNFQYWTSTASVDLATAKTEGTIGTADSAGTKTLKFTMPDNPVSIKARFVEYSATSSWYYNGYTNDSTDNSYYGQRFSAGKYDGNEYSYYRVTGRSNQNFTVSYGSVAHSDIQVKFTRPTDRWGSDDGEGWRWSDYDTQYAYFMSSDNVQIQNWTAMTWLSDATNFGISVPYGARYVIFKDGKTQSQTVNIDLKNAGTNLGYYLSGTKYGQVWNVSTFYSGSGTMGDFYEYFNGDDSIYQDTTGHEFDSIDCTYGGGTHSVAAPDSDKVDYYILVLNPGTTYNINGSSVSVPPGNVPYVVWADELPSSTNDTVRVYAKDGAIRSGYKTFAEMADTKIYDSDNDAVGANGGEYETYTATKGETITIKTTINNSYGYDCDKHFCDEYYVRGFCVNGIVPSGTLNTTGKTNDNIYTLTYTIPEDYEGDSIEITPIYYLTDTTNNQTVNFYVENFTPEMQEIGNDKPNWGNTIYAYPFYSTMHSYNNAFGSYPGQPLVCYNGFYSIQIPIYDTSPFDIASGDEGLLTGATTSAKNTQRKSYRVSGITLHNGYYDELHRTIVGYGSSEEKYQTQSFDYDDFYKIYHEKDGVDNIVFQFRYKPYTSGQDNMTLLDSFSAGNAASFDTKFGSGDFEYLTNFHGRKVNIYGDAISGTALTKSPVYVVSKATVESTVGYYGTEWVIYVPDDKDNPSTTTYTKVDDTGLEGSKSKSSIPPSLLLLNSSQSFSDSVYPSAVSGYNTSDWKAFYNALASYKDCPVMITYEHVKTTTGNATRSDGRWLYSSIGENITANIRIDVNTEDSGGTYANNTTANISGLSAVFTNAEANSPTQYATTIDPDKYFNFTASTSNPDYIFEGWYLENGNLVSKSNTAEAERSGNYTFVARFRHHTTGILMLSHTRSVDVGLTGNGTTTMSVTVVDTDGVVVSRTVDTADTVTLDENIIKTDNSAYTIKVELSAVPTGDDRFEQAVLENTFDNVTNSYITGTFFDGSLSHNAMPGEFTFNISSLFSDNEQKVKVLNYKSYFSAPTYNYTIKYTYTGKLFNTSGSRATQSFTKSGTMTSAQGSTYITKDGSGNRILSPEFINNIAPCEENFGEITSWTIPDAAYRTFTDSGNNTYTLNMTAAGYTVNAIQRAADQRTITFELPYFFDSAGAVKFNDDEENPNDRTDSAYAANEAPFMTVTKNYVLTVPYGKVPKPRYNTISSHYLDWQNVLEENDNLYVTAPETLLGATYTTTPTETTDPSTGNKVTTTKVTYTPIETVYHFQYWRIFSNKDGEEIARCYDKRFTYAALGDYTITPIYEVTQTQDPALDVSATINYLGASRNQWNGSDYGNASLITNSDAIVASDLIFEDFVCAYYYHGESIRDGISDADVTTGYVIDRIALLDTFEDEEYNTGREYYKDKYASTLAADKAVIEGYISNPSSKPASASNISIINIPKTSLNNKDRVQNYYSVYNSRGWDNGQPKSKYTYKKFVYRAFAYITVDGEVTLSDPVYFTMYDIATSQGGQK